MTDRRLARHLAALLALKLAALALLWWAFGRDDRVEVDIDRASTRLLSPAEEARR